VTPRGEFLRRVAREIVQGSNAMHGLLAECVFVFPYSPSEKYKAQRRQGVDVNRSIANLGEPLSLRDVGSGENSTGVEGVKAAVGGPSGNVRLAQSQLDRSDETVTPFWNGFN